MDDFQITSIMKLLKKMSKDFKGKYMHVFIVLMCALSLTPSMTVGQDFKPVKSAPRYYRNGKLVDSLVYSSFPRCDTILLQKHYVKTICYDSVGKIIEVNNYSPTLFLEYPGLYRNDQPFVDPVFSAYMPYDHYIKYERSDFIASDPLIHTFMFTDDQFLIIFINTHLEDYPNKPVLELNTFPTEDQLKSFIYPLGRDIPLYNIYSSVYPNDVDFPPKELNKFFDSDTLLHCERITMAIKRGDCLFLLYNIKEDHIDDFIYTVKSFTLYEIKKVELDN